MVKKTGKMFVRYIIIVYIEFSYPKLNPNTLMRKYVLIFFRCEVSWGGCDRKRGITSRGFSPRWNVKGTTFVCRAQSN